MSLVSFLVTKEAFSETEAKDLLSTTPDNPGEIDHALLNHGIDPKDLLRWKAEYFALPARDVSGLHIAPELLEKIPEDAARRYRIAPLDMTDGTLNVGVADPDNIPSQDAVRFIASKLGIPYRLYVVLDTDLSSLIDQYQTEGLSGAVDDALTKINEDPDHAQVIDLGGGDVEQEQKGVEDAPVTKIVASILKYAVDGNASDIHIEPTGTQLRVRFRLDGVLYQSLVLPMNLHSAIVARIKVLTSMHLDERRKPQDGRFGARIDDRKIDFRVSTFPSYYGEKVVIRILDSGRGIRSLDAMGIAPELLPMLKEAIALPYGMILVTGPTGSGKSTTLYAILNELDREKHNVLSLEDPVEYNIPGVAQSQVRPEIGYTFANGMRSILRQDPDIIMVGEIRDKETAQLAVQASLTGHLVLSTLHTNNAAGVIPRLIDMGVDPYLIAPTLALAIGQRLLRTLCPDSKKEIPMTESMRMMAEKQFSDLPEDVRRTLVIPDHVYTAAPSPTCPSGTKGRVGVFELMRIDGDIEHTILTNPVEPEVQRAARAKGMLTMRDDALRKAFAGIIPFEEVNNII